MDNLSIKATRQLTRQRNSIQDRSSCHLLNLFLSACIMTVLLIGVAVGEAFRYSGNKIVTAPFQSSALMKFSGSETPKSIKKREEITSGWLYVLDSNNKEKESRILLVDPEGGKVIRTFKAAYVPEMALSPDGTRLYIASTLWTRDRWGQGILQVIDTASGEVLKTVDNPDRRIPTIREYPSDMVFSPDGRWLYIIKVHQTLEGDFFYIATFDTVQGQFLPEKAQLSNCGAILTPPRGHKLNVICSGTLEVRFLELIKSGAAVIAKDSIRGMLPSRLSLTPKGESEHGRRIGPGFLSNDGSTLTVIMGDGRFLRLDTQSRAITQVGAIDSEARGISSASEKKAAAGDWLADSWIRHQDPAISTDGLKLYLGVGRLIHLRQGVQAFDRVMVFDSQTLKRTGTIKTSHLFYSLALSRDGQRLYAISPEQASITIIDTATRREIRTIYGIGTSPIRAAIAP